jgi:hypothetical protein
MDETRIDDRIDASARFGDVPSSPTRSSLHLASLSSEPLGSPYTDGSPNTAAAGLGISLRDSVRDKLLRELRQELFADMRSELLRSKQETAVVQQENAALRQRIEELESASVRVPGSPSVSVHVSGSHTSTPASPANTPLDQTAEYLVTPLFDPVISLTQLGDFTADEARWALFQSNNDLDTAAEILLSCPPVSSARIRHESLNTGQHEVEGVAGIYLSCLGPRSRQIRVITNNRYLSQLTHLFAMTSCLLHLASSRMSLTI